MEKPRLSKWVIPWFGPGQLALHSVPLMVQRRPLPAWAHGAGFSFSNVAIMSESQKRWLFTLITVCVCVNEYEGIWTACKTHVNILHTEGSH